MSFSTSDASGRMLSAVSGRYTNSVGYAYDDGGRKSSESLTIAGQTYTTLTSYEIRRAYGTDSTLTSISDSGAAIENMTFSSHDLLSAGGQNVTHDTQGRINLCS